MPVQQSKHLGDNQCAVPLRVHSAAERIWCISSDEKLNPVPKKHLVLVFKASTITDEHTLSFTESNPVADGRVLLRVSDLTTNSSWQSLYINCTVSDARQAKSLLECFLRNNHLREEDSIGLLEYNVATGFLDILTNIIEGTYWEISTGGGLVLQRTLCKVEAEHLKQVFSADSTLKSGKHGKRNSQPRTRWS